VRALLVCSSGGHLAQLMALRPWWERHDRAWVTFDTADARSLLAGERVVWAHSPTTRNIPNLVRNLGVAARVLRLFRPDVVISDGAGVAFPFFLLAWVHRAKRVYIEVFDRIETPTLTGRLCYPMSDLFLLQWEEQKRLFPRGVVIGRLI
jgi:UDP-N-acetylglucosamine:LPS N-acetylglucosamine transferase